MSRRFATILIAAFTIGLTGAGVAVALAWPHPKPPPPPTRICDGVVGVEDCLLDFYTTAAAENPAEEPGHYEIKCVPAPRWKGDRLMFACLVLPPRAVDGCLGIVVQSMARTGALWERETRPQSRAKCQHVFHAGRR